MKNTDKIIPAVILLAVLIIPLPNIAVNVMFAVALLGAVAILITYFVKKTVWQSMPKFVLLESLLVLVYSIQSTRSILIAKTIEEQNPILSFVQINYVVAIFMALVLIGIMIFIVMKGTVRISEIAARFSLDCFPQKICDIELRLEKKLITDEGAKQEKSNVMKETDFYSAMAGAAKFLSGTAKAVSFVYLAGIAGGTVLGIFKDGKSLTDALTLYSSVTFFNLLFSMLPVGITGLAISFIGRFSIPKAQKQNEAIEKNIAELRKDLFFVQLSVCPKLNHFGSGDSGKVISSTVKNLGGKYENIPEIHIEHDFELPAYQIRVVWKGSEKIFSISKDDSEEEIIQKILDSIKTVYLQQLENNQNAGR